MTGGGDASAANDGRVAGRAPYFLAGGGEMGELIRLHDWASTSLGQAETWPQSLKTAVQIMLGSRYPMFVWWGRDLVNIYNDAYRPVMGVKHPVMLGVPAQQIWQEIWSTLQPRIDAVPLRGEATFDENLQ